MEIGRFLRAVGLAACGLMALAPACIEPDRVSPDREGPEADAQVEDGGGIDASSPGEAASGAETDARPELPADAGATDAGDTDAGEEEDTVATRWVLTDGKCPPPSAPLELRFASALNVVPHPFIKYLASCLPLGCADEVAHMGPVCGRISDGCGGLLCGCAQCDESDYCDGDIGGLCRTKSTKRAR